MDGSPPVELTSASLVTSQLAPTSPTAPQPAPTDPIPPQPASKRRSLAPLIAGICAVLIVVGVGLWFLLGPAAGGEPTGAPVAEAETSDSVDDESEATAPAPSTHRIVFETAGGSKLTQLTLEDGDVLTSPEDPVRSGYEFDGWYADDELTRPFAFPHTMTSEDDELIYIYAHWEEIPSPQDMSVSPYTYLDLSDNRGYEGAYDATGYYWTLYSACIFPQSSDEYLTSQDVAGLDGDQVQRAINELFARHGYIFDMVPEEEAFFEAQPWYSGYETSQDAIKAEFNAYEEANLRLLMAHRASLQ